MTAPVHAPPATASVAGVVVSRWRPLAVGAVAVAGAAVLVLRDPHAPGSFGVCPLYALTGLYCAGCGALRATHDLLTGDLAGAWSMNPLWVVAVPLLVLAWMRWLRGPATEPGASPGGSPTPRMSALCARAQVIVPVAVGLTVVVYSVLRNVPALAGALVPGGSAG